LRLTISFSLEVDSLGTHTASLPTLWRRDDKCNFKGARVQKITTFLSFDNQAEAAANFYVSIF